MDPSFATFIGYDELGRPIYGAPSYPVPGYAYPPPPVPGMMPPPPAPGMMPPPGYMPNGQTTASYMAGF